MANDWRLTVDAVLELQESAEMDTSPAPSLQWFPQQWLGDPAVQLMGWTARGLHHHLLMVAWKGFDLDGDAVPCSLPGDETLIAGICQQPPDWSVAWGSISRAWKNYRGRWWNLGLCRSYLSQMEKRRVRKDAADARWAKQQSKPDANAQTTDANASADDACAKIVQCSSPPPSSPSSPPPSSPEPEESPSGTARNGGRPLNEQAFRIQRIEERFKASKVKPPKPPILARWLKVLKTEERMMAFLDDMDNRGKLGVMEYCGKVVTDWEPKAGTRGKPPGMGTGKGSTALIYKGGFDHLKE